MTTRQYVVASFLLVLSLIVLFGWILMRFGVAAVKPEPPDTTPIVTVQPTSIPTLVTLTAGSPTTKTPWPSPELILLTPTSTPTLSPTLTPIPTETHVPPSPVQKG